MKNHDEHYAGKLRGELRAEVMIGGNLACKYWSVGSKLCDWIYHYNQLKHIKEDGIKRLHISFEDIHPFADGNGRVGRLLYCWMRQKEGFPIHIIKSETKYEDYYTWFRR